MEVRMNNFTKAVMMVLLGLSVIGADLSAMNGIAGRTRSHSRDAAAAVRETNEKISRQLEAEDSDFSDSDDEQDEQDVKAQVRAPKKTVAKKAKKAKAVACHKQILGAVTNAGYTVLNGTYNAVKYPFVKGYKYFKSDAKVAKKKPAKKMTAEAKAAQDMADTKQWLKDNAKEIANGGRNADGTCRRNQTSRFQKAVAFVRAIPSAIWSRLPNRYRAAWGTTALAATGVAAVQVSPVAGALVGTLAAGSAYRAYQAGK